MAEFVKFLNGMIPRCLSSFSAHVCQWKDTWMLIIQIALSRLLEYSSIELR